MTQKELARNWLNTQVKEKTPVPSIDEIRRQMGWNLIQQSKQHKLNH